MPSITRSERRRFGVSCAVAFIGAVSTVSAQAPATEATYRVPSQALVSIVDAAPTPAVSVAPDRSWLLLMARPALPTIEELSQPEHRIAGIRINPRTNGPSRSPYYTGLTLINLDSIEQSAVSGLPPRSRIASVAWSPDGEYLAFSMSQESGIELWVAEVATARAWRLTELNLNAVLGRPFAWSPDSRSLLCRTVVEGRPDAPAASPVPPGPVIQEATGRTAAARTYQDLLEDTHDEALFEHYATSQLVLVSMDGKAQRLGKAGLIRSASPSPDGRYVLVESYDRPFSYLVPHYRFPLSIGVWYRDGKVAFSLADLPLAEDVPIGRSATRTGPRSVSWRADAPATLAWVEAQDRGDPRVETEVRDHVLLLEAPFQGEPRVLARLASRFAGMTWGTDDLALVSEYWWSTRRSKTWIVQPGRVDATPELLFDRSAEDRYNDPGSPVMEPNKTGRRVLVTSEDGDAIFLAGTGASPEGDRPFLDRLNLESKQSTRLWRSSEPNYESFVAFVDEDRNTLLTRRESPKDPPNYFLHDLASGTLAKVTEFPHPYPQLRDVEKEILRYERKDGTMLTATLYLPPGYVKGSGPIPVLMWAYPREYKSAEAAGQMRGSPYRFNAISPRGALPHLAEGYAVLDGPTMPIIGEGDAEPNDSYVDQLVASAEAAVDEVVLLGVGDPDRIAIGGHSYGAFMTANLLAHSDLFAAGIARSGAYNRTLTPFGFQAEERTYWEAPEVYFEMSPFMHADDVNEPILIIHGQLDNNSGTFPIQSERYFNALRGHGATARLVMLPAESHGYAARESVLHVLWEQSEWLSKYVKNKD